MPTVNSRTADHPIDPIFLERWSPRAFTGEAMPADTLATILEAARWAPSSYNNQPWRFVYAHRDRAPWPVFLDLLIEGNRAWAKEAAVLIFVASRLTMLPPGAAEEVPAPTHAFDAGAAWAYMALEATRLGWHAHGMIGLDRDRALVELGFSPSYRIEAGIAIGRIADPAILPERLRAIERPSPRKPLAEIAFEGRYSGG